MPVAHVAIAGTCAPVYGSTLEALVATCCEPALVEPACGLARLGVHQVQGVAVVVLGCEVGLAAIAARGVEVPTGNDVGLSIHGCKLDVVSHADELRTVGIAVAPIGEGHKAIILVGSELHGLSGLVHILAINHGGLGRKSHHIVVGAVNGQCQFIGLHLLEVSCQRLVAVHGVLELSFG